MSRKDGPMEYGFYYHAVSIRIWIVERKLFNNFSNYSVIFSAVGGLAIMATLFDYFVFQSVTDAFVTASINNRDYVDCAPQISAPEEEALKKQYYEHSSKASLFD